MLLPLTRKPGLSNSSDYATDTLRAQLVAKGRVRAKHFSWSKSAELYLELMARADGVSPSYRREQVLSGELQVHT